MAEWEDGNLPSHELVSALDAALDADGALVALRTEARNDQLLVRNQLVSVRSQPVEPADSPEAAAIAARRRDDALPDRRGSDDLSTDQHWDMTEVSATYACQDEAADVVRALANRAEIIDVVAVRGLGIIGLNDSLLRKAIPSRVRLRMVLLAPDSDAVARRAHEIGESTESFAAGIRLAIARIAELSSSDRTVEVYTYDQSPVWRIIRIDDVLFVSSFTLRHEGHNSPVHRLEPDRRGILHQAFVRTVEQTVSCAVRVV